MLMMMRQSHTLQIYLQEGQVINQLQLLEPLVKRYPACEICSMKESIMRKSVLNANIFMGDNGHRGKTI